MDWIRFWCFEFINYSLGCRVPDKCSMPNFTTTYYCILAYGLFKPIAYTGWCRRSYIYMMLYILWWCPTMSYRLYYFCIWSLRKPKWRGYLENVIGHISTIFSTHITHIKYELWSILRKLYNTFLKFCIFI